VLSCSSQSSNSRSDTGLSGSLYSLLLSGGLAKGEGLRECCREDTPETNTGELKVRDAASSEVSAGTAVEGLRVWAFEGGGRGVFLSGMLSLGI
jgi:hypothetical protein